MVVGFFQAYGDPQDSGSADGTQGVPLGSIVTGPGIGPVQSYYYNLDSSLSYPTISYAGAYIGPSFEYTTVPEPGTLVLLGMGGLGLLAYAWRRRRS
jgi:hypothetical protein